MKRSERPPGWARWLLEAIVAGDRAAEMADELEELFAIRLDRTGRSAATRAYVRDVLSICMRPRFWRRSRRSLSQRVSAQAALMRYEFVFAGRLMRKRAGFAFLNAGGLAVGLVCAQFIGLYVRHELAYDRHHERADAMYRVTARFESNDRHWAPIGPPVGEALQAEFPQIETMVRFFPTESPAVVGPPGSQVEVRLAGFADADYFEMFSHQFVAGDPSTALDEFGEAVISRSVAMAAFGRTDVVGEDLPLAGFPPARISAVIEDSRPTTHMPVELVMAMSTFYRGNEEWLASARTWSAFLTYVRLQEAGDLPVLEAALPAFIDRFFEGVGEGRPSESASLVLQPVPDIHLARGLEKEYLAGSDMRYVRTFSLVAVLVLLIAAFNFVNLATAKAALRRMEIGVRKTFGAGRVQLVRQFLIESALFALAAFLVSVLLSLAVLPLFQQVSGISVPIESLLAAPVILTLAGVSLLVGLLAGAYPALVLARFRPARAAGKGATPVGGTALRKTLVTVQFALCVTLLVSSAVVWSQLSYLRTAELGFDQEHVLRIGLSTPGARAMTEGPEVFRDRLEQIPGILAVSQASDTPGSRYSIEPMRLRGSDESHLMRVAWRADHAYPEALGLQFVAGRSFRDSAPRDTAAWVLNESAAALLGGNQIVGQELIWGNYQAPVVGVVRNFNFASLHAEVEPLVIPLRPGQGGNVLLRFAGDDRQHLLASARQAMTELLPGEYLSYSFVQGEIEALYRREDTLRAIIGVFAVLAILVACLGLFGLAAHSAARRTREIGIRKVLGASSVGIVGLLSREYSLQLAVGLVLAVPLAWLPMARWLDTFAYRISLSPWFFVAAGAGALIVALATVAGQALLAARLDPVRTLRSE
ncbi:MAG: ABC transporter permease [Rhodothermales bacterium]|nr:ABC transporter permease [Rhodothermales bacterium]MBO6780595.1 ABC transporter permease [Rhodothermales bacterium]